MVGVSRDSLAKHDKFADKHDLRVTLASDEDGAICENYGVWVEKKNYGRAYMGIERTTFLIDEKGKVAQVCRKVRVKDMPRRCWRWPRKFEIRPLFWLQLRIGDNDPSV